MTRPSPPTNPSIYEILNLPFPCTSLTKQQLKIAYHKALLKHHPDKAPAVANLKENLNLPGYDTPQPATERKGFTIDAITSAYKTLSDPIQRAEYDRALRLDRSRLGGGDKGGNGTVFHTGLEVVDLEDLDCDEEGEEGEAVWYRSCRCGDERGFLVSEGDLEREVESGEIVVGCRGCSLYMKVLFAVQDDEEGAGETRA
ncbi:Diphthamide biosynthesis protein 4 [Aspergillus mulundensis]|uniref:Diphthamide biosynthesis protein 4 n=1 Tax=Aspergillus mulundensis TaxID=1810919 RepID=A0A3D8S4X8_9EURO|nr:Diphthamide biosynthesis protein 4 [Aspergillus mulundensis]RDW81306.1 Diphthamide biosynthesis protein 4 [Aspergillus mulundensis]